MSYVKHDVERGLRSTKLDRFQTAFCATPFPPSFPPPFLFNFHAIFTRESLPSLASYIRPTREAFGKLGFLLSLLMSSDQQLPVIERPVRTIVTPWSGITWAYYVGCNCTVDVITTRYLLCPDLSFRYYRTGPFYGNGLISYERTYISFYFSLIRPHICLALFLNNILCAAEGSLFLYIDVE